MTHRLITRLALLALPAAALVAVPTGAVSAHPPGDRGVSGCWEWSQADGCTRYAECYARAGFCIIHDYVGGWDFPFIITF